MQPTATRDMSCWSSPRILFSVLVFAGLVHQGKSWTAIVSRQDPIASLQTTPCRPASALQSTPSPDPSTRSNAKSARTNPQEEEEEGHESGSLVKLFDAAVTNRYACKRFTRADGSESDAHSASRSNDAIVQTARQCLDLARLSPSAFNTQPYRIVLVHSQEQKLKLSRFCLGPNRRRVLDSDCTAVFLADRQILMTTRRFLQFFQESDPNHRTFRMIDLLYLAIFSSGYPIPRFLATAFAFLLRCGVGLADFVTRNILRRCYFPSLASAETWSSKQVAMAAMTYMLACSARGLATIPMEGINATGIRRALRVPQNRYAVPLIVSTGIALVQDDGPQTLSIPRRYPTEEVIFDDSFGNQEYVLPEPSS